MTERGKGLPLGDTRCFVTLHTRFIQVSYAWTIQTDTAGEASPRETGTREVGQGGPAGASGQKPTVMNNALLFNPFSCKER
jgi:hypothetical protein